MLNSFYPVIFYNNVDETTQFFKKYFEFRETFVSDWYISLKHNNNFEVAFIDKNHKTIPKNFRHQVKGMILNFEVDNVDKIYDIISRDKDISILLNLQDEDFGQRHFIIEGPNNLLIDIIQIIPPTEEFLKQYTGV